MTPTAPTDTDGNNVQPVGYAGSDAQLLSNAIRASGLSVRGFARQYAPDANIRSTWRWLKGEFAMPEGVRLKCLAILAESGK